MIMGTPGRPGMTRTGLLSAQAAAAVPIKMANAERIRIDTGPRMLRVIYRSELAQRLKTRTNLQVSLTGWNQRLLNCKRLRSGIVKARTLLCKHRRYNGRHTDRNGDHTHDALQAAIRPCQPSR